jgi:hypothetical protein
VRRFIKRDLQNKSESARLQESGKSWNVADPVSVKTKINALLFFIRTCYGSHYGICIRAAFPLFILYILTKPLVTIT